MHSEHNEITFVDVSQRMFHYSRMDTADIRNKYYRATQLAQRSSVPKEHMVETLVRKELGDDIVNKYLAKVKQWDEFERKAMELCKSK